MRLGLPTLSLTARSLDSVVDSPDFDPDDILDDGTLTGRNPFASRRSRRPKLTEAEEEGILDRLVSGAMSGVQWVGETLDKSLGGRTVRSFFDKGGIEAKDFAHLIPFSDTLGLTAQGGYLGDSLLADKNDVPGGEELNRRMGLTTGNSWIDIPAGVVTEAVLDPSTYIVGPGKAVVGGVNRAAKLGKTLGRTPIGMVEEIARGERGLFGFRLPFTDNPIVVGAGSPTAAKLAEHAAYNPISRGIRSLFDWRTGPNGNAGIFDRAGQIAADRMFEMEQGLRDHAFELAKSLEAKHENLKGIWEGSLKSIVDGNPSIQKALAGDTGVGVPMGLDDFLRGAQELRRTDSLSALMQRSLNHVPGGVADFEQYTAEVLKAIDDSKGRVVGLGGKLNELADEFVGYSPRRISLHLRKIMPAKAADKSASGMWSSISRTLNHVPGGTNALNIISRDPDIIGTIADGTHDVKSLAILLERKYGIPAQINAVGQNGLILGKNGQPKSLKVSEKLAKSLGVMPKEVLQEGLFSRGTVTDMVDYLTTLAHAESGLTSMHRFVAEMAEHGGDGVSIAGLFRDLGIRKPGWDLFKQMKQVPAGAKLTDYTLPASAADIAKNYLRYNGSRREATGVLKAYDKLLSIWKGGMYTVWPASHIRDALSGLSTNMLTAFDNPATAADAIGETVKVMKGGSSEYLQSALRYGLADSAVLAELGGKARNVDRLGAPQFSEFSDLVGDAWKRKGTNPLKGESPFNPFNLRGVKESSAEGSKFLPAALGERASSHIDFANKFSAFVAYKKRGWSDAAAARAVELAHYDYAHMSQFEKTVMRRLIPFYSFARKNLIGQIRHLIDAPGGPHAQMVRLIRETQEEGLEDKSQYVPQYLRKGFVFPVGPPDEKGSRQFLTSTNINPIEEAFNRLVVTNGVPDLPRTLMNIAAMTTPPIIGAGQLISGKQFYSGRDINDLHQEPLADSPQANMLLTLTPAARAMSTGRGLADERKTKAQRLINFLVGGQRITDVDVPKWLDRDLRSAIEAKLRSKGGIGQFTRLYPRNPEELDEETIKELAFLDDLIQSQRQQKKQAGRAAAAPTAVRSSGD